MKVKWISILLLIVVVCVLAACETMQPVVNVGTALGVASGTITQGQADSISRSAQAVGKTFEDITPEQEYYIGRAVAATVLGQYRAYDLAELNHYVNVVGQTLAQASNRPQTFGGYHFQVIDSPEINAFAAPGGLILVTRGMLRCCKTEDALAAVLAHEIAHVQNQDGLRAIKTSRLTSALTLIAAEGAKQYVGAELAQLTQAFEGSVGDIVNTMVTSGYSRELERQADETAITILRRVGYNPYALVDMLTVMRSQLKPGGAGFAKTHPDPQERISSIQTLAGGPGKTPPPAARQARFERALGAV
jgi:beta-barrel assembly-enhancing protease